MFAQYLERLDSYRKMPTRPLKKSLHDGGNVVHIEIYKAKYTGDEAENSSEKCMIPSTSSNFPELVEAWR